MSLRTELEKILRQVSIAVPDGGSVDDFIAPLLEEADKLDALMTPKAPPAPKA